MSDARYIACLNSKQARQTNMPVAQLQQVTLHGMQCKAAATGQWLLWQPASCDGTTVNNCTSNLIP